MPYAIRPARAEDAETLVAAFAWLFASPGAQPALWDAARAKATLVWMAGSDTATVLVAETDAGAIIGLCSVALDLRSIRFGQRAWVEDLAVDPDARSAGVGKRLLDAAKAWGRERGATHLELDSGDARTNAHRFYEREQPTWTSRCFGWAL